MGLRWKRITAIFLVAMIAITAMPDQVFAQGEASSDQTVSVADRNVTGGTVQENVATGSAITAESSATMNELQVIGEDLSKRTLDSKTFIMSDHSNMAVIYKENVHYYQDGTYKDIDNSLEVNAAKSIEDFNGYENKDNNFKIKFADHVGNNSLVRIQSDQYKLSWNYLNVDKNKVDADIPPILKEQVASSENEELKAENNSSEINYNEIENGVDLQYRLSGSNVKENIIVKQKRDNYIFSFSLDLKNLDAKLNENGSISIFDSTSEKKAIYNIPAPYLYDAKGVTSDAVKYQLEKSDNGYVLKIVADERVMNAATFPVTIDPIVQTELDPTAISCSYVESNHPSANKNEELELLIGNDSYYYGNTRTYVKFALPTLNKGDMVVSANMNLYQYDDSFYSSGVNDLQVNAYPVNESWSAGTLTWSNKPANGSIILDYDYVKRTAGSRKWDITRTVKDWYDGDLANNGIMLKANTESTDWSQYGAYGRFWSDKYNTSEKLYPLISINYRNNKGLEDYWTYHEVNAGTAGTAYINDYTGNLVMMHEDVSTAGGLMPVAIQHVYNGYMAGIKYSEIQPYVGHGWRLNIEQTIRSSADYGLTGTAQTDYPYVYTDGDGTEHYFYNNNGTLVDEDGLGLVLVKDTSSYTITDKSFNKMTFNSSGNLISITDANSNQMTITYSGSKITKVTDGAGNIVTITENVDTGSGYIRTMTDSSGRVTTFYFDAGNLIQVLYPDGKSSTYEYDSDGAMTKATDSGGYSVTFGYTSATKGKRVNNVLEKSSADASGQKMTMDYSKFNETIFTNSGADDDFGTADDASFTYQFDNTGKTTAVKADTAANMSLGATKYNYSTNGTSNTKTNNKLQSQMELGRNTRNYITNANAENTKTWVAASWVDSCTFTSSYATDQSYLGNKSFKLDVTNVVGDGRARYYQDFNNSTLVPGSTYTLSAYVKTSGITGTEAGKYGACINVNSFSSGTSILSEYSDYLTGTTDSVINNGWKRLTVTFTVPTGATSTRINLAIRKSTGTAWFDAVQLETGDSANKFNMIENASMENNTSGIPIEWRDNNLTSADGVSTDSDRVGSYGCKIVGNADQDKELVQDIDVKGVEDDTYIVSGWAKANAVPNDSSDTRKFKISARVQYSDGYEVWKAPAAFNNTVSDWQYTSQSFDLSDGTGTVRTPVKISIYLRYYKQVDAVSFDDIQLIKDDVMVYSYDANGNIVSAAANTDQKTGIEYDSNTDISSQTDANGNKTTYTYDANHNMTKSVSPLGINTINTYQNGLCNSTTIKNSAGTMILSSSATIDTKGFATGTTDTNGYTDSSVYDESKGLLNTYTDQLGNVKTYTYNADNDLLTNVSAASDATNTVDNSYTYDSSYHLKTIHHNGFDYTFNYDDYGNPSSVYLGTNKLISYDYHTGDGKLNSVSYGNNDTKSYVYNDMNLLSQLKYNNNASFNWSYDSNGTITKQEDLINHINSLYDYDSAGRLVRTASIDTTKSASVDRSLYDTAYSYDKNNNVTSTIYRANGSTVKHNYQYGQEDRLEQYTMPTNRTVTMVYDSINRLTSQTISTDTPLVMSYIYWLSASGNGNRTMQVKYETINGVQYTYTYDKLGNITEILKDSQPYQKYTYNKLSELIRVDSKVENLSKTYTYDAGGNIISLKTYAYTTGDLGSVINTIDYQYGDTTWKDKLTSYNGKAITYDSIGNPLTYGTDASYQWHYGRELASASVNGNNVSYTYDSDGMRVSKTVNGTTSNYLHDNGQLAYEKRGTKDIFYYYNANGQATGLRYDGLNYYFTYNTQGDIIGIYNGSGALKASYEYNEWGKLLSIKDSLGNEITDSNNIGIINPLRYRGYYYDTETGLYYLQSRYYNPEWGRFLNADAVINGNANLIECNMFAYSSNNPVNYSDPSGSFVETAIDIASIIWSGADLIRSPSWSNFGFLVWDVAAACIPFVPGSYTVKGGKAIFKFASKLDELREGVGLTLGSYKELRKMFKGVKNIEIHHLVEKRFKKVLGISEDKILSIPLEKGLHRIFTNRWRKVLPYGKTYSKREVLSAINKVYQDNPKLLGEIKKWLRSNGIK